MKFLDYYKVMGVAEDASPGDIKKAYRRLARKFHPDVSEESDAEARFKDLGEAYEVLKDPEKRAEYDQLRKYGVGGEEFSPPPGWRTHADSGEGGFTGADPGQFSDFFEAIFGGRRPADGGPGPGFAMRGEDVHYRIPVTLEESFAGGTRTITLSTHRFDPQGRVIPDTKTLNVRIPDGVVSGQRIRLRGQGGAGMGDAPGGDLYLEVELAPHPRFTVDNRDVTLVLPVAPWETALGATVRVPTLGGAVSLNVPTNARAGQRLRLRGRGLPGDPPGDQYVVLQIVMPEIHSDDDREVVQNLQQHFAFDPRAKLGV